MGQKINSTILRTGISNLTYNDWIDSFKYYNVILHNDIIIRNYINFLSKHFKLIIGYCYIKRSWNNIIITIEISSLNEKNNIDNYKLKLEKGLKQIISSFLIIHLVPIKHYIESPQLLANYLSNELEKRKSYKELFKKILNEYKIDNRIKGFKLSFSGRLDGIEIAKTDFIKEGILPLHTIKSNVRYAYSYANTIYGKCGIKIWICYI